MESTGHGIVETYDDTAFTSSREPRPIDEKKGGVVAEVEDDTVRRGSLTYAELKENEYVTQEDDSFVDPRLKDYPIPLVAKTVDLHNDPTEPILTFRWLFLSTFWVIVGCAISSFYYFKPFAQSLSSYAVQLLSWGMGYAMEKYLPTRTFNTFGYKWSMNPSKFNAKEHALIVVAYWGSCYTAYGLGPLSALELYYGKKVNPGWGILFLLTSQLIGYGFVGIFRDNLVRPPKMYYPGVLPNVALFQAMHKSPAAGKKALRYFAILATAAFFYTFLPQLVFPLLGTLSLLCYMGHGNPVAYVLGSGNYGFGMLTMSLDWNYIGGLMQPLYTPLWSTLNQAVGVVFAVFLLYPILYYNNSFQAQKFGAFTSETYDNTGAEYNISRIVTPQYTLNQTALDEYSMPHWSTAYVFNFFWGFAASTGAMLYATIWYGKDMWTAIKFAVRNKTDDNDHNDPYLRVMNIHPRVPHWWYYTLLAVCFALSIGTIYGAGLQLPWWGFIVMSLIAWVFTFPNGVLWAVANQQVGMTYLSEVISGSLFHGQPIAVLTSLTYTRQILEQNLNLISDYKFGFYMKIPEKEMFIGQVYGTLLGPFINYGVMRIVLNNIDHDALKGLVPSVQWNAVKTRNYYSISVLWGLIGPKNFFGSGSEYHFLYYGFLLGPAAVLVSWGIAKLRPKWDMERYCNFPLMFYGVTWFPIYSMTNFNSGVLCAIIFMGYIYRYHPVWWRKYNYLTGVGLDCGTQIMALFLVFCFNLPNITMPQWWGNNLNFPDRCFPPNDKLPVGMQVSTS